MYIGHLAKKLLEIVTPYIDISSEEKSRPVVDRMKTYKDNQPISPTRDITVLPLSADHSAPDAYMFYIKICGKNILYTGDFRDHGIVGQNKDLYEKLDNYRNKVDLLITEGTMLSRVSEVEQMTEKLLGKKAAEHFRQHKYNFVLVSSMNLDSIMEFYQNTPPEMPFVCDLYQAKLIIRGMQERSDLTEYQTSSAHPVLHILEIPDKKHDQLEKWRYLAGKLKKPLDIQIISHKELEEKGFVMLARKNSIPDRKNAFEKLRDEFRDKDIQIIYSMWGGYLPGGSHPDMGIASFLDGI